MKKIVLKVVKQCATTEGVTAQYIKQDILPDFFRSFWVRRMALDRRNYKQVVETTVELAQKAGSSEIIGRIVNELKDEAEPYRKMVMETITKVVATLGASDVDERLEVRLVDGIIHSFRQLKIKSCWTVSERLLMHSAFALSPTSRKLFRLFFGGQITRVRRFASKLRIWPLGWPLSSSSAVKTNS